MNAVAERSISPESYEFIAKHVYEHSRIRLGEDKHSLVVARLGKRLNHLGIGGFEEYCDLLRSPQGIEELRQLIDLISTNHTEFFREIDHFHFLFDKILPELDPRTRASSECMRVWSAACSSGEEPYSIAIALSEFFLAQPARAWEVSATDISSRMLEKAKAGIFRAKEVRLPNPQWLTRYFQRGVGRYEGHYRVREQLRNRVAYNRVNLFQPSYPVAAGQHVIFCRNVMIYFDQPTRQELVQRLVRHLAPGGYLIVGHSESLLGIRHPLATIHPGVYRAE
jgi:chemotaxis protein methyltransferase CheR